MFEETKFLIMPAGAAMIVDEQFPDEWFSLIGIAPSQYGVELKNNGGEAIILPFDLADHLVKTRPLIYIYYNNGVPLLIYDTYIEIGRDLLIETIGGSKVLAQNSKD